MIRSDFVGDTFNLEQLPVKGAWIDQEHADRRDGFFGEDDDDRYEDDKGQ